MVIPTMMTSIFKCLLPLTILCYTAACSDGNKLHEAPSASGDNEVIGFVTVDLNASTAVIRKREALLGNLIADALKQFSETLGLTTDIGLMNGGAIRFNEEDNPDGIYPAGEITGQDLDNLLPFSSGICVITITGSDLKSILERSVAGLSERESGAFLHVSSGFSYTAELSMQAQVVNENVDPNIIIIPGQRISTMMLNGNPVVSTQLLRVVVSSFIAGGGDAYVTFAQLPDNAKECVDGGSYGALTNLLQSVSPITIELENRIILNP